ncbi:MAG: rRNA pseudouridine synthase [Flavobacteriaceae bacterium]|nr:rRNA pseudouridine synthase [Bacteroidia bacterium]MBT8287952.1 rRNA pseudouridine synthase [Bacteroidia bacterium]NNF74435.1 rRNA pseudouridine synthase [Flavobacteriaceae bacterium]NNK73646.1 rRNA pseudouridine synthase [Flavobacteriaceae bacterium]
MTPAPHKKGPRSFKKTGGKKKPYRSKTGNSKKSVPVTQSDKIRLNKYIANSGICSRREADMHISIGSVTVNGKVVTEMGHKVSLTDEVRFDGQRITPERKTYVLLNKPKGFATTTSETKGRTVMDLVANATNARIQPIGRLGRNATGLLLFTNDDDLVRKFKASKHGVARLFHVELDKNLKMDDLKAIQQGLKIDNKLVEVEEISYIEKAPKSEVGIKIKNIGNMVIRRIFDHMNYQIVRLDCVMIGNLTKKDLPRSHWKHLTQQEINGLMML